MARRLSVNRAGGRGSAPPKPDLDDLSKLKQLSQKKYVDQAQWFLNAYWSAEEINFKANPGEAEKVWQWTRFVEKLDKKMGKDGNELEEFEAHIFLEKNLGALTVKKMRQVLAEIDVDFNKKVSLTEFLIYNYRIDYKYLVNAVVDDKETEALINAAKEKLAEAQRALEDAKAKAEEAVAAAAAARAAAMQAQKDAEAAAKKEQAAIEEEKKARAAAEELAAAEAAAKEALAVLEAEQKAYDDLCAALDAKSKDASLGIVKRNKAAHELAQLKEKDPLPLNRAKINQGAAVRRVGKARKRADAAAKTAADAAAAAAEARRVAEAAAAAAKAAAVAADAAAEAAQAAVLVADKAVDEAADILEDTKKKCMNNTTEGTFWWMDRDWEESKKYMSSAQIARLEAKRKARSS